ncbi:hypothetical protein [Saccharococcus caldoxylosilyticus]|uniref:Uncharacterized protein n=1 Tax=Parageobacillus caldoxylosilyticus NBRC 107762 TaxID=1220594 RepID=A0A023DAX9_9BACL|nr:hypothetical protein [Parageobacillus caldoxylosilyticus]OQP04678.1 hypothetical protein BSK33_02185 [Geobacillus sp. 44B]MBB3851190.1 hypothetical protein [Parageobacillus caldoxylosilyticus]QNU39701.1 hypothetical protein IC801_05955 [Geobacillus sp. 44B]BDG37773.1 hypothetical protein PcaKH15_36790 [Parageobacillus caldoxylosilyticus]BDG41565.1 hypothetical protein PcaKH16_37040 [Parageobacillus caldoxylosilyticus]
MAVVAVFAKTSEAIRAIHALLQAALPKYRLAIATADEEAAKYIQNETGVTVSSSFDRAHLFENIKHSHSRSILLVIDEPVHESWMDILEKCGVTVQTKESQELVSGYMTNNEKDVKLLGKQMEKLRTNKELQAYGKIPDPLQ